MPVIAVIALCIHTGAAAWVRQRTGLPNREEIAQWWIHRGTEANLEPGERPLVFLITGQSNAGNYGEGIRQRAPRGVYNAYKRRLYRAQDPLLGSDGLGVSQWIEFANKLLKRGSAQAVVLALAVRGGRGVRAWSADQPMRRELFFRIEDLRALGLTPDYVLWQQGESDAPPYRTSQAAYADSVRGLVDAIRAAGVRAPVLIAQATRNRDHAESPELREAQRNLIDPERGILGGPDADGLGAEFRYDGVHFSARGLSALADAWIEALIRSDRSLAINARNRIVLAPQQHRSLIDIL